MSINALGVASNDFIKQITEDSAAKAPQSKTPPTTQHTTTEDTTSFTTSKPAVQNLTQTALQTTPTRAAKVEALKQQVNSAEYSLDSAKIAESLVNAE
jgi:flagellar biosynthesis anti-sigma factor FlgM